MRKKNEIAMSFYQKQIGKMNCPICKEGYQDKELLTCHKNHHFTLAKQGYFNFVNHKVKSEYTKEMLIHRRNVINGGIYNRVINELEKFIWQEAGLLLDAGTGEGSFLNEIRTSLTKFGIDLSKEGILLATDYNKDNQGFAVADLTNIPLKDQSVDVLLNFLSPAMYQEFKRVLKKNGRVIKVIPGTNYLKELRRIFYQGTKKANYSNDEIKGRFMEELELVFEKEINYQVELTDELQKSAFEMSPLTWNVEKISEEQRKLKTLTIDLVILVGEIKEK